MPSKPKLTRNPNRGKHSAARLGAKSDVRWSEVKTSYMPGKTIAARIAGIQAYYTREAERGAFGSTLREV